jgi:hypothetical protein
VADKWSKSVSKDEYPHLFSFAKDKSISIDKAWNAQT